MSPEIIQRKLDQIRRYLTDLKRYQALSREAFEQEHYAIERLIELLVESTSSIAFHALAVLEGTSPGSYREAFRRLGALQLLDADLARRMGLLAGMRNILVHGYEQVNLDIVHASIQPCIRDVEEFVDAASRFKLDNP